MKKQMAEVKKYTTRIYPVKATYGKIVKPSPTLIFRLRGAERS